mgnify:CR=1 FL=1|tara:strand:- start:384 stop:626 length:243 start_codon:yes stop_codon:yes gene_type:complete
MLKNITVYSKDDCPYCQKVCDLFDALKASYVVYKLNDHFNKKEFYNEFGEGSTFPQVTMGTLKLGGSKETVTYLKENGLV